MARTPRYRMGSRNRNAGLAGISVGTGTIILCILTILATVVHALMPDMRATLVIDETSQFSFISLVANTFVVARSSLFGLLFLLGLICYFLWPYVKQIWYRARGPLIGAVLTGFLIVYGLDTALGKGVGSGLLSAIIALFWFGSTLESRWGEKRLLFFSFIVVACVNSVGALIAVSFPGSFTSIAGRSSAIVHGTTPLIYAFLTVWCLMFARTRLAILNIEARTLIWVLAILGALDIVFVGRLKGLMTLTSILVAYLLVSGLWRPRLLLDKLRLLIIESRIKRRRNNIRIVDKDRKYH
ncbi:MAG: rhomboid family intramembrane serine protease [Myxococcota bacterium]|nr:rhomboid family intramembrane serine protease [Myxococcota bacterium]